MGVSAPDCRASFAADCVPVMESGSRDDEGQLLDRPAPFGHFGACPVHGAVKTAAQSRQRGT